MMMSCALNGPDYHTVSMAIEIQRQRYVGSSASIYRVPAKLTPNSGMNTVPAVY